LPAAAFTTAGAVGSWAQTPSAETSVQHATQISTARITVWANFPLLDAAEPIVATAVAALRVDFAFELFRLAAVVEAKAVSAAQVSAAFHVFCAGVAEGFALACVLAADAIHTAFNIAAGFANLLPLAASFHASHGAAASGVVLARPVLESAGIALAVFASSTTAAEYFPIGEFTTGRVVLCAINLTAALLTGHAVTAVAVISARVSGESARGATDIILAALAQTALASTAALFARVHASLRQTHVAVADEPFTAVSIKRAREVLLTTFGGGADSLHAKGGTTALGSVSAVHALEIAPAFAPQTFVGAAVSMRGARAMIIDAIEPGLSGARRTPRGDGSEESDKGQKQQQRRASHS